MRAGMRSWWRTAANAGLLSELWRATHGGNHHSPRRAYSAPATKLSVGAVVPRPATVPVRDTHRGAHPSPGRRLPGDLHLPHTPRPIARGRQRPHHRRHPHPTLRLVAESQHPPAHARHRRRIHDSVHRPRAPPPSTLGAVPSASPSFLYGSHSCRFQTASLPRYVCPRATSHGPTCFHAHTPPTTQTGRLFHLSSGQVRRARVTIVEHESL